MKVISRIKRWIFNHLPIRTRSKILYRKVIRHNNRTIEGTIMDIFEQR